MLQWREEDQNIILWTLKKVTNWILGVNFPTSSAPPGKGLRGCIHTKIITGGGGLQDDQSVIGTTKEVLVALKIKALNTAKWCILVHLCKNLLFNCNFH